MKLYTALDVSLHSVARGHRRAVIAVARKLAVILHKMWMNGTDFRWAGAEAMP